MSLLKSSSGLERPQKPFAVLQTLFVAALLGTAIFAPATLNAQPKPSLASGMSAPPGIVTKVQAVPDKATVGDVINIDIDVALPEGFSVRLPQVGAQIGEFSVLEVFPGPSLPETKPPSKQDSAKPGSGGFSHHRARIVVSVYKTGEFSFPSLELTLRDAAGRESTFRTEQVKVGIRSVLAENDRGLRDLKKQAEIPEPTRWLLWTALALLAVLLISLSWWMYSRRARAGGGSAVQPPLDTLQIAEAELRDLMGRGLLEKRLVKQFYVALSDIVKRILEAGYGIATAEKTTDEILDSLRGNGTPAISRPELDRVATFLSDCDMVKFARFIPAQSESEEAIRNAYDILSLCRKRRSQPEEAAEKAGGGA